MHTAEKPTRTSPALTLCAPRALAWAVFLLTAQGCGVAVSPGQDAAPDSATEAAAPGTDARAEATVDAPSADSGLDPLLVGQVASSCGSSSQGLTPVDCTASGDTEATCVFGNHCGCSARYRCVVPNPTLPNCTGALCECAPGSGCVPR